VSAPIYVGGDPWYIDAEVRGWREHGLHFATPMRTLTKVVINHWTGAENSPMQMFNSMRLHTSAKTGHPEPLSVQFAVDALGVIWQFADASARCSHCAGSYDGEVRPNSFSVGIEFICRGTALDAPSKGVQRQRAHDMIHGHLTTYDDLTPAQVASGIKLNEALCAAYELPMRVPQKGGDVYATALPAAYASSYRGCAGHLNFQLGKSDPGLSLLRALHEYGRAVHPTLPPRNA
jgi:hypothetical protein